MMMFQSLYYIFISSLVAVFPVLNPIGNGLIINEFLVGLGDAERKAAAKKIFINCLMIGLGSLLLGQLILLLFGLAIPVIQVGGGIIICKTGFDMLSRSEVSAAKAASDQMKKAGLKEMDVKLFYPLSFPMTLGPGSISVIFTLMAASSIKGDILATGANYFMIAAALAVLLAAFYLILLNAPRLTKKISVAGNVIINKFVAFITFCIGIQIIATGIAKIFHLTIL